MKCQYKRCSDLATRRIIINSVSVGVCCLPHAEEMAAGFSARLDLLPRRRQRSLAKRRGGKGGK